MTNIGLRINFKGLHMLDLLNYNIWNIIKKESPDNS